MGAPLPFFHMAATGHGQADGQPGAQSLRQGHDVRRHAPMLTREHPTRAPDATLNLVENQQNAVPVAQIAQSLQEAIRRYEVAALALNRLNEYRSDLARRD